MTFRLELEPELESRITAQAAACGLPVETYLQSLINRAVSRTVPGAATLALFDAWDAEDQTDDPAELQRRRQEFEEFKAAMNANRPGQREIFP